MSCDLSDRVLLLAGAGVFPCVLVSMMALMPAAAQSVSEETYRQEALAHSRAVEAAYRRVETFIRDDSTAETAWTGSVPPAETGWLGAWTTRGVRARYCDDTLLVYLGPESLKGVGRDHRVVRAAPHVYAPPGDRARPTVLHWLEGGQARGSMGRGAVVLPDCLSDASFGGTLPSGRAALAGAVPDPYRDIVERVTHERRVDVCPAGQHGVGRTMIRAVRQEHNGRGDPVGNPAPDPWEVLIDWCRADYTEWEHYSNPCFWTAGPPHNRRMEGREIWRRLKTVTAGGTALGTPEFVSSSCWTGGVAVMPTPAISEIGYTETRSDACPGSMTGGGRGYWRLRTEQSTQFPWDVVPVVQVSYGNWILESDDCQNQQMCWAADEGGSVLVPCSSVAGGSGESDTGESGCGCGGNGGGPGGASVLIPKFA